MAFVEVASLHRLQGRGDVSARAREALRTVQVQAALQASEIDDAAAKLASDMLVHALVELELPGVLELLLQARKDPVLLSQGALRMGMGRAAEVLGALLGRGGGASADVDVT